jgi:1-acyl-sn-glycerol-3-phosphate acyltransferase
MKFLLAPLRILYCLYSLIIFILLMLSIVPFVVAGSFFGKIRVGNFIYKMCIYWADAWCFLVGIRHRNLYDTPHDPSVQYIFVANHISYLDAPVIVMTLRQKVRVLGKVEMAHIPLFGYIYKRAIVTVDRRSAAHRANSVRVLKSVLRKNISIFIFPEGTFNETHQPLKDFYDGAFRIAIETQTPVKPILFLDAYARMPYEYFFSLNPGKSRSVFLEEISVKGLSLKDVPALKKKVYESMEQGLLKYKASWIKS